MLRRLEYVFFQLREYFRPTFYGYKIHFFLFLGLSCNLRRTFVFVLRIMNVTRNCKGVWSPSYLSLLSTIISVAFCLVITVGNLMVVVVVVVDPLKKLRSLFNYFVVNLAVADLEFITFYKNTLGEDLISVYMRRLTTCLYLHH